MKNKWRTGLIYLFKFVYILGVFEAVYFLLKYFAESVD